MKNKVIVVLTGPSCSGKSFLSQHLMKSGSFGEAVSTTTRAPRSGEQDGVHYHFVDNEAFERKKANNEFIETIEFSSKKYGITANEFEKLFDKGLTPLVVAEPNGAEQISNYCAKAGWSPICLFINVPTKVAVERFVERFVADYSAKPDALVLREYSRRLTLAVQVESSWGRMLKYDHVFPISDTVERAASIASEIKSEVSKIHSGVGSEWLKDAGNKKLTHFPAVPQESQDLYINVFANTLLSNYGKEPSEISLEILRAINREKKNELRGIEC